MAQQKPTLRRSCRWRRIECSSYIVRSLWPGSALFQDGRQLFKHPLSVLPARSHERRIIMQETANLYGVSEQTLYRALAQRARPRALRRSDRGTPRVLPQDKMAYYCELIAALKVRTSNKKARHLSTGEAIRLIEEFGV